MSALYSQPPRPPAMSTAAVAGFVCSMIVCIPVVTQLLGLILGIVGIGRTSGGRARGRGLAIAALCIAGPVLLFWIAVGAFAIPFGAKYLAIMRDIEPLLAADVETQAEQVRAIREEHFSARLKLAVDAEATLGFVRKVREAYGRLDEILPAEPAWTSRAGGGVIRLVGKFARGEATIDVTVGFNGLEPEIDNISVGELVLAPEQ
ncbi:MAG TPA: DUF4190 domain-containing protein [Phycisphaerae bacterium]|nr:DUF4190 domain-containing protein [Phycisphaerae bacterium]HUU83912.1 DUF4190 domain-containing protein [Phycisphaerae bacterium]